MMLLKFSALLMQKQCVLNIRGCLQSFKHSQYFDAVDSADLRRSDQEGSLGLLVHIDSKTPEKINRKKARD